MGSPRSHHVLTWGRRGTFITLFVTAVCQCQVFFKQKGLFQPRAEERQVRGAFVSSVRHTWEYNRDLIHLLIFVASTVKAGNRELQHSLQSQKEWDLHCCLSEDISLS